MLLLATIKVLGQDTFSIPNEFHGYNLGTALNEFESKNSGLPKTEITIPFTEIITRGTTAYTLKGQLTEASDKIDITFFFFENRLSVIRVEYKSEQSRETFQRALKSKYGNLLRYDDKVYRDPASGALKTVQNIYWEKSDCCILCFTSFDTRGTVYLTFAEKSTQAKLKSRELKRIEKKIE
jgi:hypothetical protein